MQKSRVFHDAAHIMKAQSHLPLPYLYIDLTLLFEYILYDLFSIIHDTELCVKCHFIVTSMYYYNAMFRSFFEMAVAFNNHLRFRGFVNYGRCTILMS